jgi:Na+(H+)/acetate symporter ActP
MTGGQVPGPLPDGGGQAMAVRPDAELAGLDVAAAISDGIGAAGERRHVMFTDAAIAAAIQAEALGAGPYPVGILSRFVRAGGITAALRLPEPLVSAESSALARSWMEAALAGGRSVDADLVFARWLEMVATLMAARRSVRSAGTAASTGGAAAGTSRIAAALRGTAPGAHAAGPGAQG